MSNENRIAPRINNTIEIQFKTKSSFVNAYILNVNTGGVFIKTDDPPLMDTAVTLKIQLPGDYEPFETQGKVVWINMTGRATSYPKGMGIKFLNLPKKAAEMLREFVKENLQSIKEGSFI